MKRTHPILERKTIEQFCSHLADNPGAIQMVLPLAGIAQLLQQGVSQLLHEAENRLPRIIMKDAVTWLTGDRYARGPHPKLRRWG